LPKDTKMFLNSSKSIKSKIIEAAIQVDSEYRKSQAVNRTCQSNIETFTMRHQDIMQIDSKNAEQPISTNESFPSLISGRSRMCSDIDKA
jgi:hypothetical protein